VTERPDGGAPSRRRLLHPGSWPVGWRLAVACAGLTLAILLVFAAVIGRLASERIRDDFNRELRGAVTTLAVEVNVLETPAGPLVTGPQLNDFALPNEATVRILDAQGRVLEQTRDATDLGPPRPGVVDIGDEHVATARIVSGPTGRVAG
jgi:hypothetical protein